MQGNTVRGINQAWLSPGIDGEKYNVRIPVFHLDYQKIGHAFHHFLLPRTEKKFFQTEDYSKQKPPQV